MLHSVPRLSTHLLTKNVPPSFKWVVEASLAQAELWAQHVAAQGMNAPPLEEMSEWETCGFVIACRVERR